jgi:aminodeoxyfutalosine synthase
MASARRRARVGDKAFYQFNFNINYTNICENECRLCAFYRDRQEGFTLGIGQIAESVGKVHAAGVNEVHVVGGLNRDLPYDYYLDLLRAIKSVDPEIHIQGFTAVEIAFFADIAGKDSLGVLKEFKAAGLGSLPGGGAEIFSARARSILCEKKLPAEGWLRIHEEAHSLGLSTNATMLYGHVETPTEIVDHLARLRRLQDRTGGIKAFVPLAFFTGNTELGRSLKERDGYLDMRVLATARIFLDNIDHLKSMWMIYGYKECQVGLDFGADDIGGTYFDEIIVHSAGAKTPKSLTQNEICDLIRKMGRIPVQVNSNYETLREATDATIA